MWITPVTPAAVMTITLYTPFVIGAGVEMVDIHPGSIAIYTQIIPVPTWITPLIMIIIITVYRLPLPCS